MKQILSPTKQESPIATPTGQESRKITCSLADQNLIQQTRQSIAEAESNIKELTDKVTSFENSEQAELSIKVRDRLAILQQQLATYRNSSELTPESVRRISDTLSTEMNERIRNYHASLDPLIQGHKLYLLQMKPLIADLEFSCY